MLVQTTSALAAALSHIDTTKRVYIDLETTSFNDEEAAFRPYHGDRTSLMLIGQTGATTNDDIISIPLRHRTEGDKCIDDLNAAKTILAAFAKTVKILANANVKFDMHFMGVDNIDFVYHGGVNSEIEDTLTLARLVYNEHPSYSLEWLANFYKMTNVKKGEQVKEWLAAHPSKDYGTVPFNILVPYGCADVLTNIELHEHLLKILPEETHVAWNIEKALTPILYRAERRGIPIDKKFLQAKQLKLLIEMLALAKDITAATEITNLSSSAQIGAYFIDKGIISNKRTEGTKTNPQGGLSWDKDVLEWIGSLGREPHHVAADKLLEYGKAELAETTFCRGWLKHLDSNNVIHGNNKQAGTRSGRSSSENPNLQNPPKWIYEAIQIPKGRVGIAWDLSQIEYRLFAHYAKDPAILAEYEKNPSVDFHQILADRLGIPRNPTKRVNFGILYGMGKGKTTTTVRREIIENDSDALRAHLYEAYYNPSVQPPKVTEGNIPQQVLVAIAENILAEYHRQNPTIKQMQQQIRSLLAVRGYIKTYYGMRCYLGLDKAYVGLNRAIQGSAAHLFKQKMAVLMNACWDAGLDVELDLQIHDAVYADMPLEHANAYIKLAHKIVSDCPFRVPVLMDFELALYNWKNRIRVSPTTDIEQEVGKLCFWKSTLGRGHTHSMLPSIPQSV